jgi:spore photoproduct lyase
MIDTIYFEEQVAEHPRSQALFKRFSNATRIPCSHYKEIFNPSGQNFRLQKKKPALILAQNTGKLVHPVPATYGIGGNRNFYFSHMLNCLYDCRYCFLQGMYPSAHYLLFVNYEDFFEEIKITTSERPNEPSWFFSGYDCDSLALESITGFAKSALSFFKDHSNAYLELRTKSVATQLLEKSMTLANVVTAFSFTPQEISDSIERGVPSVAARLSVMKKLALRGWLLGIRLDPIIDCVDFDKRYESLINKIFDAIPVSSIHSVSLGPFRLPEPFFKKMEKLYPAEALFAGDLEKRGRSVSYRKEVESQRIETCQNLLLGYLPSEKIFLCQPVEE